MQFTKDGIDRSIYDLYTSEDERERSVGENIVGASRYPDDYWIMPDYYYPGIEAHKKDEWMRTSNERVLAHVFCVKMPDGTFEYKRPEGWLPRKIEFLDDENIVLTRKDGESITIPWELLCGLFLKAREMGYKRPECLDEAGPMDDKTKEQWLKNQEKIIELQSTSEKLERLKEKYEEQ